MEQWQAYITVDSEVAWGKPVFTGTRISVSHVLGLLAQGWDEETILENHPRLTAAHLLAVYAFAKECMDDFVMFPRFGFAGNKSA